MSIGRGSWLMGGLAIIAMVACSGSEADEVSGWPKDEMLCEAGFSRPEGFRQREAFEDPYEDHVGIRLGFVDDAGRELHYFAGIPGEFGEGLPVVGRVEAASDLGGLLQGDEGVWVLSWRAPGPCGVRAVLGSGFSRRRFLRVLREAGAIPA